jgi:hypothetical protein
MTELPAVRAPLALALVTLAAGCGGTPAPTGNTGAGTRQAGLRADAPAWAADAVRAVVDAVGRAPRTFEHVASPIDEAGPRLPGSPGDALAVAWGMARWRC